MGVTIHFQGRLKSQTDYEQVIQKAEAFAVSNNMTYQKFEEDNKLLQRIKDEEEWDYTGAVKGIKIKPNQGCEPLWLEFDRDLYVQDFCKTQFAGIDIHILIVSFLKSIATHFEQLDVNDESEFYETADFSLLEEHYYGFWDAFDNAKAENPKLKGPFFMDNERIVDLMEV